MMTQTEEDAIRLKQCKGWMQETLNGVAYDWGLAGPSGAWFVLFREPHHTDKDMEDAKHNLYQERDVVSLRIRRVE